MVAHSSLLALASSAAIQTGAEDAVIDAAMRGEFSDEDIAHLARLLASSGEQLSRPGLSADLASTGGPGSLSTLIGPLCLRSQGWEVRTLGVPGRPAGGVDVLSRLPGYRLVMTPSEVNAALDKSGYVHLLAADTWTPLDASLFRRRQARTAQACPPLVIASLLSKKVAFGVTTVGLDVRIATHGNFGQDRPTAQLNADRFLRVARLLQIEAHCFLSDGGVPAQPYIGRGEALLALNQILAGRMDEWLAMHVADVWLMTEAITGRTPRNTSTAGALRRSWEANLVVQGCDMDRFKRAVQAVRNQPTTVLKADKPGRTRVNLERLRDAIVGEQRRVASPDNPFPDPCGVILLNRPGTQVGLGDEIARIRSSTADTTFLAEVRSALEVISGESGDEPTKAVNDA